MTDVRERRSELLYRLPRLQLVFMVLLVSIASSYGFVQVVRGDHYRELADNNRLRKVPIHSPRGRIYDREGRLLADNVPSYNLLLDPSRSEDVDAALAFASSVLEIPEETLAERLGQGGGLSPRQIAERLSLAQVARISVSAMEFPEFEVDVGHLRLYRHGETTTHLLGYLGEVGEAELNREGNPYRAGDLVGKKGIERAFDEDLRGLDGEFTVTVDSRGRRLDRRATERARAGQDLTLAVDLELQQVATRYFEDRVGAAVAMDPRTGEVLAIVSAPSYDPNLFSRRLDRDRWREILEDPRHPLQNRVLQNVHPPGSVFKIVLAVAGLMERATTEGNSVYCSGSARFYSRSTRCWKRGGHGWVNLHKALRESCDIYFYRLGQELGIQRIARYARLFGFGSPTGFEVAGEKSGLVPDSEWSLRVRGTPWYPGETISVAIGQGPILVTPLQVARAMAIVATGGEAVAPKIVRPGGPAGRETVALDPRALQVVKRALWAVVNEKKGTAYGSRIEGVDIAGKTGTAQVVAQETWIDSDDLEYAKRDHAWFASFAPTENAELVVVVFVEHGGHGSTVAAPLAKQIYETYFGNALAGG